MTLDIPILYEDESFIVINKPPGIVVNRADSVKEETVQDWAEPRVLTQGANPANEEEKVFFDRAGIVHRIDKETSGCLIIAKHPNEFMDMQRQFKERTVKKTYLAIAHGKILPEAGEIHAPVGRLPWNRERFGILPGGKDAVTKYQVVRYAHTHDKDISLVSLFPETGRTHQIRVHLKYLNHPIIGDWQYAGRKTARADRVWAPRVMLHAWKVSFIHSVSHQELAIEAPVPDDMKSII